MSRRHARCCIRTAASCSFGTATAQSSKAGAYWGCCRTGLRPIAPLRRPQTYAILGCAPRKRTLLDFAPTREASLAASYSSGWTWCQRCQVLFSGPPNGVCPAGGAHDGSTSWSYFMLLIEHSVAGPNQQPGWRTCGKCRALFYGPGEANSSCPAGGRHAIEGFSNFAVQVDDGTTPSNQQSWRWCKNCQSLFFAGNASNLRVQGSNYTLGGQVDVFTMFSNGQRHHAERVRAIENQSAPGGWITAGTSSLSPPGKPGEYNGYVQAHDVACNKWSPKLPIVISQRID